MTAVQQRGLFLTVEGGEGVGKTSNIEFIKRYLEDAGIPLICTREPGGTPFAESIRELLLKQTSEAIDPLAELLLVYAARAQHFNCKIVPALERGTWVLSDRFTDATYAYQGGGRKLPMGAISKLEKLVQQHRQPDKTFYLDLDVQVGLERARGRGALDRFEQENVEFFEDVRAAYWDRVHQQPERFAVIDASVPLAQVQAQITVELDKIIPN